MLAKPYPTRPEPGVTVDNDIIPEWMPTDILAPHIYTEEYSKECGDFYAKSSPYHFLRINELCTKESMLNIRKEVVNNLKTFHRETDLFKVSQSIDFNNISLTDEIAQKIPYLMALRQNLYSKKFREFLETTLQCGKLSDRVDMAANEYKCGLQLGCHDDGVQVTRKLSFIVYASIADMSESLDNMDPWEPKHGGHLELYQGYNVKCMPDHFQTGLDSVNLPYTNLEEVPVPMPYPCKLVCPEFNTMVIFEVKPGESFHSVQEVYGSNSNRISIQGWFHAAEPRPVIKHMLPTVRLIQAPVQVPNLITDETQEKQCLPKQETIEQIYTNTALTELPSDEIKSIVQDMFYTPETQEYGLYSLSSKKPHGYNVFLDTIIDVICNAPDTIDVSKYVDEDNEINLDVPEIIKKDLAYLRKYINPAYTMVSTLQQMREEFQNTGVICLADFINDKLMEHIIECILDADIKAGLSVMVKDELEDGSGTTADGVNTKPSSGFMFDFKSSTVANNDDDEEEEEEVEEEEDEDVEYIEVDEDEDEDVEYVEEDEDEEEVVEKVYPPSYTAGIDDVSVEGAKIGRWMLLGPPHKRRHLAFKQYQDTEAGLDATKALTIYNAMSCSEKAGIMLQMLKQAIFQSSSFSRLLHWLTGYQPVACENTIRWFRAGLDYSIGSYDELLKTDEECLFVNLCFVDDLDEEKSDLWASDDVGGFLAYVPVDRSTEGDDAEAFVMEDDTTPPVISLSAECNTLTIVKGKKDVLSFVRYVNGHAPGSRFDIHCKVHVVATQEEE